MERSDLSSFKKKRSVKQGILVYFSEQFTQQNLKNCKQVCAQKFPSHSYILNKQTDRRTYTETRLKLLPTHMHRSRERFLLVMQHTFEQQTAANCKISRSEKFH